MNIATAQAGPAAFMDPGFRRGDGHGKASRSAIEATLARLGLGDNLAGRYTDAILAAVIAVLVLVRLGKLAARVGGAAAFEREAEG